MRKLVIFNLIFFGLVFALLVYAQQPVAQSGTWTVTANIGTTNGLALDSSLSTLDTDVKSNITLHAGTNKIGGITIADGDDTTLGAKADAKSTATDTTAVSIMSVLKEISAMEQAPASQAVTNAGTFAVQAAQSGNWTARIVGNAGATLDQAPGSAAPTNAIQTAGTDGTNTRVPYMDPCAFNAWTYYVVNVSANTQIVAGSSSKKVYICKAVILPVAAAANVNLVESATSGNACATSPTGMLGGATAALGAQLSANGGFVLPADQRAWAVTATAADAVCIFASAQVTGVIAYVQF